MAVFVVSLVVLLAMAGHSSAAYCVCKDGVGDAVLQKNIDYACGNGADCSAINPNGACYNPNTVKDHCNYAVNSYYQRKSQSGGTCDFSGTATITQTVSGQSSACVYPSSSSGTTPSTAPPTTTTPPGTTTPLTPPSTTTPLTPPSTTTPLTPPSTTTPSIVPPATTTPPSTMTPPSTTTPSTTTPGSSAPPSVFGLAPTGTGGITNTDNSGAVTLHQNTKLLCHSLLILLFSGLIFWRV